MFFSHHVQQILLPTLLLFLCTYNMVNTAWANNPCFPVSLQIFPVNSSKFSLLPIESLYLEYSQKCATLGGTHISWKSHTYLKWSRDSETCMLITTKKEHVFIYLWACKSTGPTACSHIMCSTHYNQYYCCFYVLVIWSIQPEQITPVFPFYSSYFQ